MLFDLVGLPLPTPRLQNRLSEPFYKLEFDA